LSSFIEIYVQNRRYVDEFIDLENGIEIDWWWCWENRFV